MFVKSDKYWINLVTCKYLPNQHWRQFLVLVCVKQQWSGRSVTFALKKTSKDGFRLGKPGFDILRTDAAGSGWFDSLCKAQVQRNRDLGKLRFTTSRQNAPPSSARLHLPWTDKKLSQKRQSGHFLLCEFQWQWLFDRMRLQKVITRQQTICFCVAKPIERQIPYNRHVYHHRHRHYRPSKVFGWIIPHLFSHWGHTATLNSFPRQLFKANVGGRHHTR